MKIISAILMTTALILTSGGQEVFAQGAGYVPGHGPMTPQRRGESPLGPNPIIREGRPVTVPRASEIISLTVTNDQQEYLGSVEDLILGSDGRISYLVVSRGGFFGIGDKLYAIPWQASNPRIHEYALLVNISEKQLEGAPTLASWDAFKKGGYQSNVRAYYGEGGGSGGQTENPMNTEKTPSVFSPH